jgi:hypothetical protein
MTRAIGTSLAKPAKSATQPQKKKNATPKEKAQPHVSHPETPTPKQ